MDDEGNKKQRLKPITIRLSPETWTAIEAAAKENGMNKTEFIRVGLIKNLDRYLANIRIIDEEQAEEIKSLISALYKEIAEIKVDLHRIGVNYNQEIRLRNIERKYSKSGNDVMSLVQQGKEKEMVISECKGFSQQDIDGLIARYEAATERVGKLLCHILA